MFEVFNIKQLNEGEKSMQNLDWRTKKEVILRNSE